MSTGPQILIDFRGRVGGDAPALASWAGAVLTKSGRLVGLSKRHELSLLLCDNPAIARLNRRWRAMDKPTDVLSFPLHELKEGQIPPPGAVGDIVISLPTTRRAARELGVSVQEHLAFLLIHGLLHLIGYDHLRPTPERRMFREQRRLMQQGGFVDA